MKTLPARTSRFIWAVTSLGNWLEAAVVAINLLVVWVLARDLRKRRR